MSTEAIPSFVLKIDRVIAAPPARVFAAWTEPEQLKRWYALDDSWETPEATVDLRVGGAYRIGLRPPGKQVFHEQGTYLEVEPPARLVYTQENVGGGDAAGQQVVVTVMFEEHPEGCRVVVVEEGYTSERVRDMHASGWPRFLDRLVASL